MVGKCPKCLHPNFPFHMIASDVDYVDQNGRPEQSVFCSYDDCVCVRHLEKVKGVVNTEQIVSPKVFRE